MSIRNRHTLPYATLLLLLCLLLSLTAMAGFDEGEAANRAGDGVTAFKEYRAAANAGDNRAYGKLGSMYLYGPGTEKNYQLAYVWFGLSNESGDKYGKRFQNATASIMSRDEIRDAEALFDEYRNKLGLSADEGAN